MKKGTIYIVLGLLLLAAAFGIFTYQTVLQQRADTAVASVLVQLSPFVEEAAANAPAPLDAAEMSAIPKLTEVPDYLLNPMMPLPTVEIGSVCYVGILSLPELGVELPIRPVGGGGKEGEAVTYFLRLLHQILQRVPVGYGVIVHQPYIITVRRESFFHPE